MARRLVSSSGPGPGDLVLELGAGTGNLTNHLAETGARILAVERRPDFVARLERRFASDDAVRVVADDIRTVPLPRRPFAVVANLPYSASTSLLRRLLTPDETSLRGADVLVEWGFAKRVTATEPRDFEIAWWQLRFDIWIARRVAPHSFTPPPSVATAHLVVRRRTGQDHATIRRLKDELRRRYRKQRRRR